MMQRFMPHKLLTFLIRYIADSRISLLKNLLIRIFILIYKPDLNEAIHSDIKLYSSYNDFFTRKLKVAARNIELSKNDFISPVDGEIVDHGKIEMGKLIQAKNYHYDLSELIGSGYESLYEKGYFITIYLAPTDYHRIHCPFEGQIERSDHLGEYLYSVNKSAQNSIPKLYLKNERAVLQISSSEMNYCLVSVGASIVGSIVPYWNREINPSRKELIRDWKKGPEEKITKRQGEELAYFRMGSTVIVIFEDSNKLDLDSLKENKLVKFGSKLISLKNI